jgi:hypothetical protein
MAAPEGTIRRQIEDAITAANGDVTAAAIAVVRLLDDCGLGLHGNGWLDDDQELVAILQEEADGEGVDDPFTASPALALLELLSGDTDGLDPEPSPGHPNPQE